LKALAAMREEMKTDDLIDLLTTGDDVQPPRRASILPPLAGGLLVSVVLLLTLLGVRPNLLEELTWPAFWSKLVFSLALAAAGWLAVRRLCAPGARTAALPFYLGAPVLAIWLAAQWRCCRPRRKRAQSCSGAAPGAIARC
jgi:hypothetical protein